MQEILKANSETNILDSTNETPLFGACSKGRDDVVALLLSKGANPNLRGELGLTPLHWAASHANRNILGMLIDSGALTDQPDDEGELPVDRAHRSGKGDNVAFLKLHGPEIRSRRK